MCATHSVTQLYDADGAEGFFLFVNKFTSICFALVSFKYEPYAGNQRRSRQDIAQFGLTPGLKHVKDDKNKIINKNRF